MLRFRNALVAATVLSLIACGGGGGGDNGGPTGPPTPTVASVSLSPSGTTIAVGATVTLTTVVTSSSGGTMTGQTLTWSSSDAAVATVAGGVVKGVSAGKATIKATSSNGKSGSSLISVVGAPASVTITRSGSYILVGDTLQLRTVVKDATGNVLTDAPAASWTVSGAAATLAGATLTAVSPAAVTVTATVDGATGNAAITIWPGGGTRVPELASVDSTVIAEMSRLGIPGGSVSVTKDGRLVLSRAYGWADTLTKRQAAPNQLYRIGSTSKPITAVAIMKLVEEGKIGLDDRPFSILTGIDVLPGQTADPREQNITVRDLLRHSGGWNVNRDVDSKVFAELQKSGDFDPETLIRSARGVPLATDPGTSYAYTNYEYLVLGRMIEHATGQKYQDWVNANILGPAGITDMKLGRTPIALRDPLEVTPYDTRPVVTALYGTGRWPDVGGAQEYAEASGQWIGSSLDLVKFLSSVDGNARRPDLLSAATIGTMTARSVTIWPGTGYHYALGWEVNQLASGAGMFHAGAQDGGDGYIVRRGDGVNMAALFNLTRNQGGGTVDPALNLALDRITVWPASDGF